jgi:hypothetical protein
MAENGLDPEDAKICCNTNERFLGALHRLHVAGAIREEYPKTAQNFL